MKENNFFKTSGILFGLAVFLLFSSPCSTIAGNLQVEILSVGTGDIAQDGNRVEVHYTGKLKKIHLLKN